MDRVSAQAPVYRPFMDLSFLGGSDREVGQGSLFLPLLYDTNELLFADLRGAVFDDSSQEGNWGLAYRRILDSGWIAGLYGFYDLRGTQFGNTFQQARLRRLFRKASPDIEETIKWGAPCFEYKGIVAGMAAFKQHVSLNFWKGQLMNDQEKLFSDVGDTCMTGFKLSDVQELPSDNILLAYIREAVEL